MPERLLRSHFVRRFLDNDLISPDADRHEVLAAISAVLIGGGLFITLMMSLKFLMQVFQSPGRTAVLALGDRFFFFGISMTVMALGALASWNALSLDARDVAILGPLPIERRAIVRAKLASVAIVAAGAATVLNGVTSVLYPILVVAKLPIGLAATGELIFAHALVALSAGAFGFLAVLAVRELLHAALGTVRFMGVSVPVHASLTVAAIVAVLLLPGLSSGVAERWLVEPSPLRWRIPPLWFLGLHEYLAGDILMRLPHGELPRWIAGQEARLAAVYASVRPSFGGLAAVAASALIAVASVALPAYWWNNRRIDGAPPAARGTGRSWFARITTAVVNTIVARHPLAQAGYWLACRSVMRSLPHRVSIATAAAVAIAATFILLPFVADAPAVPRVLLLVPQLVALIAVVVGFRHAMGLPADVRGNWVFHIAWMGDARHYLAGVKRFGLTGIVLPTMLLLYPIYAVLLGIERAGAHALLGAALGAVLLQVAMLGTERLPLACAYAPGGTLKTRGPVYLFGGIVAIYWIGRLERAALSSVEGTAIFVAAAIALYTALGMIARRQADARNPCDVAPPLEQTTQRLGLSD